MTGCQRTLSALACLVNVLVTDTPATEGTHYQGIWTLDNGGQKNAQIDQSLAEQSHQICTC